MMTIVRNVVACFAGLLLGGGINIALLILGPFVIAPPAGVDATSSEALSASLHLFEPRHFVFPFLAHAAGTFSGSLIAFLVAASHRSWIAYFIGVAFLLGGIATAFMIPAPTWYRALDLVVAYVPMAWLGLTIGTPVISWTWRR